MDETLQFNPDELTVGQLEFLTEYTGRTIQEFMDVIEQKTYRGRDLTAMVALAMHPDDPEAGLDAVRDMKASDIELAFSEGDEDDN